MCVTCGCGHDRPPFLESEETQVRPRDHHHHDHSDDHYHRRDHHHHDNHHHHHHHHDGPSCRAPTREVDQEQPGNLHFGLGLARVSVAGFDQGQLARMEQEILDRNSVYAEGNRRWFADHRVLAVNLMSGTGAGKTTLLVRTVQDLKQRFPIAVIEGDQETTFDADRIRAEGIQAVQVNTGRGCHLDAHMVECALGRLALPDGGVLFIENVGNLVCPAGFDLGERHGVVMLSVTEGEDKPLKYPDVFAASELLLITKMDLLPHVRFDVQRCADFATRVNPSITVLPVSVETGAGLDGWYTWIAKEVEALREQEQIRAIGSTRLP
ncbi:MAG: hydrogenase nickel incorporation protein HypB [Alphaproteobacteria bacterium]